MREHRFLLILTSVILVILVVAIWFYPSSVDFREENPFWNGLKTFTSRFDSSPINSLDALPSDPKETALVVIPQIPYTEPELEKLGKYLSQGGTLIVMDDFGYGNDILGYLGIEIRFTHYPLLDPLYNYKNKRLPEITDFTVTPLTDNVNSIVLNHATSLSDVPEADIIAKSSIFSFSDLNGDSNWDEGDVRGPLPAAAALKIDEGYLVLITDPSILINSMEDFGDNRIFIENIFKIQYSSPRILLDQSHIPVSRLDTAKTTLADIRNHLSSPLGISLVIAGVLLLMLSPLWIRKIRQISVLKKKEGI